MNLDKNKQGKLFELGEWWEKDWQGMPEFVQDDLTPFKEINLKFRNREDMEVFMVLLDQVFTMETKSIWFPKLEIKKISNLRYKSES